jgi:hypothetical protein
MCLRQLVVSPALIREYSRHMRRPLPPLGAYRGLGSRRLQAKLEDVCAGIDPISTLLPMRRMGRVSKRIKKSRGRLIALGIVNVVSTCGLDTVTHQVLAHSQCKISQSLFGIVLFFFPKSISDAWVLV